MSDYDSIRWFAHSVPGRPESAWEPLLHHSGAVGRGAADRASAFNASTPALVMGLLHDIGKCSELYKIYIQQPIDDGARKRGPDHSTAGAKEALATYGDKIGKLMAFGIAGHHGGLMDGQQLMERRDKRVEDYSGWRHAVAELPEPQAVKDGLPRLRNNVIEPSFTTSFLVRMLFSALVDADFVETERFYAHSRDEEPPLRGGVITPEHRDAVRAYMASRRRSDTPVNELRSAILDHANAKSALPPGLFTLTVPTGGGKTLTSLSFAMEHALTHGLRRIIYVIPFTSIIEQTAAVFRDALGDKLKGDVLEHHSSFDPDKRDIDSDHDFEREGAAGLAKLRRDTENWDSPIIVTTAVQFFESLFAARTSKARKLHNLAKSVIIIDEAQSIPVSLLRPCVAAIDELARNYGATVVLCTATQPALRVQDEALPPKTAGEREGLDIPSERELAPEPSKLYEKLKRVIVEWRRAPVSDAEIAERFAQQPQMLCIVNSRAHARDLFEAIRKQEGAVHLTTLMCARHRRTVLAKLRADLKKQRPVRLVATSLIEAGVDVDFPEVWRAAAGLQSIAQSAGRCNREGRLDGLGRTVVFEAAEHKIPPMIDAFYEPAREVLRREMADVLGLDAIHAYYKALYWRSGYKALDCARYQGDLFPIIIALRENARSLDFPFEKIAKAFRMIDDVMDPVIVPWDDDAREAIEKLRYAEFPPIGVQRTLQQYVVPVPSKAREAMLASGAVQPIRPDAYGDRFIVLESTSLYDPELGLRLDDPNWRSNESNIFS